MLHSRKREATFQAPNYKYIIGISDRDDLQIISMIGISDRDNLQIISIIGIFDRDNLQILSIIGISDRENLSVIGILSISDRNYSCQARLPYVTRPERERNIISS